MANKPKAHENIFNSIHFSSVQSFSRVWLFVTPWTAAWQASLSITNSRSLLKFKAIRSVMPSNHLILIPFSSCLQSFPSSGSFQISRFFASGGQRLGVSASASDLPMKHSVQFSSVAQSCSTLCDPMYHSTPGFPVHHQLLKLDQTPVHGLSDTIQPSHPHPLLLLPSIFPTIRVFSNESVLRIKVLEVHLQHQSFQWILRVDFL